MISLLKYIQTYLHPNLKKVTSLQIIKLDQRLFEKIIYFLTTIKSDFRFFIKLKGFDSSDLPIENDYVNATFCFEFSLNDKYCYTQINYLLLVLLTSSSNGK